MCAKIPKQFIHPENSIGSAERNMLDWGALTVIQDVSQSVVKTCDQIGGKKGGEVDVSGRIQLCSAVLHYECSSVGSPEI